MIRYLEVKGLNNKLSQSFEFNEDLNIFTGPNGSGKTTLLKLICSLISGHLAQILAEIPFAYLSVETDMFSLTMAQVKSDQIELNWKFTDEKQEQKTINTDPENRTIDRKDIEKVNKLEKRIAQTTKSSLFFPTFRRIEGGFFGSPGAHTSDARFLSVPEVLQTSVSRFASKVSVNGHKIIASISTEDIGKLLTQKYAALYEEITNLQSQVLEDISEKMQNNPDKGKVSDNSQDAPAVLNAIQKVNKKREQLIKPFSALSELTRKILQYNAIRVTGQVAHGEVTDGITLGEGKDGITFEETKDAISLDILSAGEKQMLSFLCYNAFSKNTAIFIDEPELSLHVDWQRLLFPILLQQKTGNQFFVATHSPFIYARYPDKEFLLDNRVERFNANTTN